MKTHAHALHHQRRLAAVAAALLLASLAIVGPLAQKAFGATYTASDQASWVAAVANALANTGEPNTITLTADIALGCSGTPCDGASFTGGSSDLVVDGNGHTFTSVGPAIYPAVLGASGVTSNVTFQNLTIDGFNSAAAVYISTSGTVTFDNVTVKNSGSDDSAIVIQAASPTFTDSTFTDNSEFGTAGAALHLLCTGTATIRNSTFTHNTATLADGGAVYSSCDLQVYDSTFTNNHADGSGGAIYGGSNVATWKARRSPRTAPTTEARSSPTPTLIRTPRPSRGTRPRRTAERLLKFRAHRPRAEHVHLATTPTATAAPHGGTAGRTATTPRGTATPREATVAPSTPAERPITRTRRSPPS